MQKNWRELIKPKKLEVDRSTLTATYGKFVAEPLERGFGTTIGNSLRRILLSSLRGAAITHVKFDKVLHEFSSIQGVKEDVSDIMLNLKQVRIKLDSDDVKTLKISAKGPCQVTAKDIECDATTTVLNGDLHIANLDEGAELNCDLTVVNGKGYEPAEDHNDDTMPVGTIPMDAIFQPVIKVNFDVTHARVGQTTDYDKLTMEVWTTGAQEPQDAVAVSAKILKDQLTSFITFDEEEDEAPQVSAGSVEIKSDKFSPNLFKTVDELELSVRSANCLKNADIKFIGEMVQKTEQEMLRTKNFGRKSLNEIKAMLLDMGLDFGMQLDGFPTRKDLENLGAGKKEAV